MLHFAKLSRAMFLGAVGVVAALVAALLPALPAYAATGWATLGSVTVGRSATNGNFTVSGSATAGDFWASNGSGVCYAANYCVLAIEAHTVAGQTVQVTTVVWKMASTVKGLSNKKTRIGTYDNDLNYVGP